MVSDLAEMLTGGLRSWEYNSLMERYRMVKDVGVYYVRHLHGCRMVTCIHKVIQE